MTDEASPPKNGGFAMAWCLAALMALIAVFAHLCFTEATSEFRGLGVVWALMLTCPFAVIAMPVVIILVAITRHWRGTSWFTARTIKIFGFCLVVIGISSGIYRSFPKVRLDGIVGSGDYDISEVEATGFNGFLAHRWLFSFRVPADQVEGMATGFGLSEHPGVDLRKSLENDIFLSERAPFFVAGAPGAGASRAFTRFDENGQAVMWLTLIYSEDTGKAWLFKGFQN